MWGKGEKKNNWGNGEKLWLATELRSRVNGSWVYGMPAAAQNPAVSLLSAPYPSAGGGPESASQGKEEFAPSFEEAEFWGKTWAKTATVATLPGCFDPCSLTLSRPLYRFIFHQYNAKRKKKKKKKSKHSNTQKSRVTPPSGKTAINQVGSLMPSAPSTRKYSFIC